MPPNTPLRYVLSLCCNKRHVNAPQASEALADLLCHPSGDGRGYADASHGNTPVGRLQSGMGYLSGGGGGGGAAAAAAAREGELHWEQLMFLLDM